MARVVGSPQRISAGRRLAALAVVGAFTIAACGSDSDSGSSAGDSSGSSSDKALVIARGMDVNSLDPSRAYCDTCQIYMTAVYETLIGLDDDNTTLVPRLATAWESNAEQTEFTFTLDPTAKFADGSAVTSADVKYSRGCRGRLHTSSAASKPSTRPTTAPSRSRCRHPTRRSSRR